MASVLLIIYFGKFYSLKIMHGMCGTSRLNSVSTTQTYGITENILCLPFINICTEERVGE